MKDAKMFGIDDRGAMDFISLVCRGFYGNITKENVISLLRFSCVTHAKI